MTTPAPPPEYSTWLDYAISTLHSRTAFGDRIFSDGEIPSSDEIRKAAQDELDGLRNTPGQLMLRRWAKHLEKQVSRTRDSIIEDGLLATDFPRSSVQIRFEDGSVSTFKYAFWLGNTMPTGPIYRVAVFTEHCGYHEFWLGSEDHISQI